MGNIKSIPSEDLTITIPSEDVVISIPVVYVVIDQSPLKIWQYIIEEGDSCRGGGFM